MSTLNGGSRWSNFSSVMAHWSFPLLAMIASLEILFWFYPSEWISLARVALLLLVIAGNFHIRSGGLCVRCMTDVPVDPAQQAQRYDFLLRYEHQNPKTLLWTLGLVIVVPIVVTSAFDGFDQFRNLPLTAWMILSVASLRMHHRLRPWCPYCRDWDDEGDPERVPDPTESGTIKS